MEEFRQINLGDLYESPLNTRKHFDEKALGELIESVKQKGVLVPLLGVALTPTWAALAMSLSSLFVVGNSLRIRRVPRLVA